MAVFVDELRSTEIRIVAKVFLQVDVCVDRGIDEYDFKQLRVLVQQSYREKSTKRTPNQRDLLVELREDRNELVKRDEL